MKLTDIPEQQSWTICIRTAHGLYLRCTEGQGSRVSANTSEQHKYEPQQAFVIKRMPGNQVTIQTRINGHYLCLDGNIIRSRRDANPPPSAIFRAHLESTGELAFQVHDGTYLSATDDTGGDWWKPRELVTIDNNRDWQKFRLEPYCVPQSTYEIVRRAFTEIMGGGPNLNQEYEWSKHYKNNEASMRLMMARDRVPEAKIRKSMQDILGSDTNATYFKEAQQKLAERGHGAMRSRLADRALARIEQFIGVTFSGQINPDAYKALRLKCHKIVALRGFEKMRQEIIASEEVSNLIGNRFMYFRNQVIPAPQIESLRIQVANGGRDALDRKIKADIRIGEYVAGDMEVFKNIVSRNEIDIVAFRDSRGNTLLHLAAQLKKLDLAWYLVKKGVPTTVRNGHSNRIMDMLPDDTNESIRYFFTQCYDHVNIVKSTLDSEFYMLCGTDQIDTLEARRANYDVNLLGPDGESGLIKACKSGHQATVDYLLKALGDRIGLQALSAIEAIRSDGARKSVRIQIMECLRIRNQLGILPNGHPMIMEYETYQRESERNDRLRVEEAMQAAQGQFQQMAVGIGRVANQILDAQRRALPTAAAPATQRRLLNTPTATFPPPPPDTQPLNSTESFTEEVRPSTDQCETEETYVSIERHDLA